MQLQRLEDLPAVRVAEQLLARAPEQRKETRAAAYAWLKGHYDAFVAVLSEHHRAELIGAAAGFCSEDMARDVEATYAPRAPKLPGGPRELAMTLESIRLCAALEQAQGEKARAYFAKQPSATANRRER